MSLEAALQKNTEAVLALTAALLAAGKPVPDAVLADYPDLAAKYSLSRSSISRIITRHDARPPLLRRHSTEMRARNEAVLEALKRARPHIGVGYSAIQRHEITKWVDAAIAKAEGGAA